MMGALERTTAEERDSMGRALRRLCELLDEP
jgi:hypothetical protein